MLLRRLLPAFLVVAGLTVPVLGQDKDKAGKDKAAKTEKTEKKADKGSSDSAKADLKWKFEKGKTFYQKMTTDTKQAMKVMGNDVNQTQRQTFYFSWTPVEQKGDAWQIKQKIEGVQMEIDIGGSKINYDSTKDTTANNPLGEFFKALVGSEFTLTLDTKTMKVTKIDGRTEFVDKLVKANPQMKPLLEQILSEKALKEMAEPTFSAVPNKTVSKGEKWNREFTLDMGPIGKYDNKYTYTFEGKDEKEKNEDRIKAEATLTYKEPGEVAGATGTGGLPFKIKGADLKSTSGTGYVLYNPQKQRVDKSNMKIELKGDLNIDISGTTTKVELSQTQETTVETSDTNPLPKK